ncbi:hypothetical protein MG293_001569 [Ovis ammon polii]|uniref:Uncharacterized protein n=1 Tax=Ovis ammon polii TaxID=230172 RepID=A0AAD4UQB3_OVIAM|nr:hypothetical protein MG293_001569 [Ovis ammon polii]
MERLFPKPRVGLKDATEASGSISGLEAMQNRAQRSKSNERFQELELLEEAGERARDESLPTFTQRRDLGNRYLCFNVFHPSIPSRASLKQSQARGQGPLFSAVHKDLLPVGKVKSGSRATKLGQFIPPAQQSLKVPKLRSVTSCAALFLHPLVTSFEDMGHYWQLVCLHPFNPFLARVVPEVSSEPSQTVKNLPVMRETWIRFLGRKDAVEKEMATHSSILALRIPWTEEPGTPPERCSECHSGWEHPVAQTVKNPPAMQETWVQSLGREDPRRRNGYPFQYSCLENSIWTEEPGELQSMGSQRVGKYCKIIVIEKVIDKYAAKIVRRYYKSVIGS